MRNDVSDKSYRDNQNTHCMFKFPPLKIVPGW